MYVYIDQDATNLSFSENFAYVLNELSFFNE